MFDRPPLSNFREEVESLRLRPALDYALGVGVRYADIRVERTYGTIIELNEERMRELSFGVDSGIGVRVLYENAWGFASTTELSATRVKKAFEEALSVARALPRADSMADLAEVTVVEDEFSLKPKLSPEDVSVDDKLKFVKYAFNAAKTHSPYVKSVTVVYVDGFEERLFMSSEGALIVTRMPAVMLRVRVVARRGSVLQEATESVGAVAGLEFLEAADAEKVALRAADRAVRLLDAKLPPAGRVPVIMDNKLTGVFMHEALGHAAEADHVLAGESILADKLGTQIASPLLNVFDDPTIECSHGFYKYDDEGVPARRTTLIKDGVLVSYLHSRETAGELRRRFLAGRGGGFEGGDVEIDDIRIEPTGNARAAGYSEVPLVRMSNTVIAGGDWSFEEMLEDVKFGIYAKGMRGGQVDTTRGEFQFSAEEAFLVERGELKQRLKNVSLSGLTLDALRNVDAVGKDFKHGSIGFCGKDGQEVPVAEYAPHVRIKEILVGGAERQ
ncbi:MAG: Zn-dependent protease PmbA/TldA [Candidatus Alkanophagales archaeon MCA70_species_1]|nr:Zn-dependent protease PmbA/TldA [Candidatus Alkanophaga volatiphilum]